MTYAKELQGHHVILNPPTEYISCDRKVAVHNKNPQPKLNHPMHARKIQLYHIIISSPKYNDVMNGGCAEKQLSHYLYKESPHQKQSHMMESRGIKVEKNSFHGGPPVLPKGINRGALSPQISNSPLMHIISSAQWKHKNNSSLTWEVVQYIIVNSTAQ
ncbi:hypothetical protein O181_069551 [Austropuccinia psidii MF-1]|uniref:Uncharacterized protein n=1 Tax=Austropuccinia psidii MF-1 TaxID=1389203 RepID=A0A9Q3F3Q2_9BASI|nr:hypothetical protein [Austropuccinia psidii MF-1]